jgi:hypothetical protein
LFEPLRLLENAIVLPSGDHAGSTWKNKAPGDEVSTS